MQETATELGELGGPPERRAGGTESRGGLGAQLGLPSVAPKRGTLLHVDLGGGEAGAAGGLHDDLAGAADGQRVLEAAVGLAAEDRGRALAAALGEDLGGQGGRGE